MTTILGVKTGRDAEPEGIVLASDTQLTDYEDGKIAEKRHGYKLISGPTWAMGYAGLDSDELDDFFNFMRARKKRDGQSPEDVAKEIEKSIKQGYFERITHLNRRRWPEVDDIDDINTFVLAVNTPALAIYGIDEFGNIKTAPKERKIYYESTGSSKKADEYIDDMISSGKIDLTNFGIDDAIRSVFEAMSRAERDIYTGGPIDMMVLTRERIDRYGKMISENRIRADKASMEAIISRYAPPKEQEQQKQG